MRTLLAAIVLAALIVTGVATVVPLIARPIIAAAVQRESPFGAQHLDVDVDCNVFGLLRGSIDRIHVHGTSLKHGNVDIGAIDVTLTGVATSGRDFRNVAGTIAVAQVPLDALTGIAIDQITLDGPASAMTAVATLDHAATVRVIEAAFADSGVDVSGVDLGNGTVVFHVFGTRAEVPIGVANGAIVIVDPFGQGDFEIVTPGPNDGWSFTGVGVTPGGMTIDASLDVGKLLASS